MKKSLLRSAALAAVLAVLAVVPVAAQTFDQYVALGDSLTAGWESGCLVQRNQVNSFPAVIARTTLVPDFQLPLVSEGPLTNGAAPKCLQAIFSPPASISVVPYSEMGNPLNLNLPRPYNDLGIPGLEVQEMLTPAYNNPIAALVLRNTSTQSPFYGTNAVQQADALLGPATGQTLVTLWIGNNNTLGASTSGIVVPGATLISPDDFQASFEAILANLLPSSRLAIANIPDVTSIPFSTTIPPVVVDPTTRQPVIINGSVVPLLGPGDAQYPCTPVPPDQGCALPPGSLVNLTASSLLGQGVGIPTIVPGGTGVPLPHGFIDGSGVPHPGVVLYPDDIATLAQTTQAYNSIIESAASSAGATFVDANALLADYSAHGVEVGGITLTTSFLTGGIFGYDGVHPSTIGYSLIADEWIKALNAQGTTVYARPNLSNVLFTPNPANPGTGASVIGGGPWGYTYDMWRTLLASVAPKMAGAQLPAVPEGRVVRPPTRSPSTVTRTRTVDRDPGSTKNPH